MSEASVGLAPSRMAIMMYSPRSSAWEKTGAKTQKKRTANARNLRSMVTPRTASVGYRVFSGGNLPIERPQGPFPAVIASNENHGGRNPDIRFAQPSPCFTASCIAPSLHPRGLIGRLTIVAADRIGVEAAPMRLNSRVSFGVLVANVDAAFVYLRPRAGGCFYRTSPAGYPSTLMWPAPPDSEFCAHVAGSESMTV